MIFSTILSRIKILIQLLDYRSDSIQGIPYFVCHLGGHPANRGESFRVKEPLFELLLLRDVSHYHRAADHLSVRISYHRPGDADRYPFPVLCYALRLVVLYAPARDGSRLTARSTS